ncbi:MAG: cupin domain-containing protein [bacterium]|nr:cupin domain-containing protein [bacterium]
MKKKDSKVIIKKLRPVFRDTRGDIFDIVEDEIHHIGFITFRKGAVRANHYHKRSTQYTYVIKGKIELMTKDAKHKNAKAKKIIMSEGVLAVIPPFIIHAYRALTPASIIDCTTESRNADGYEKDTIRVVPE